MPEEEDGRRSSLLGSGSASRERLLKEGTLVVLEMPTSLRIPGDGTVCVALDVNLGFLRSGGRDIKSSLTSARRAGYRRG
jgi:hypothetical protein